MPDGVIPELPTRETISFEAGRFASQLRFAGQADRQHDILVHLDKRLRRHAETFGRARRRAWLEPDNEEAARDAWLAGELELIFKMEMADLFVRYADPGKITLAPAAGEVYQAEVNRLSRCFAPHLSNLLMRERELVARQFKRMRSLCLQTACFGAPSGVLNSRLQHPDRAVREAAYGTFRARLAGLLPEMQRDFLDLHTLRNQLAVKSGYRTFEEYQMRRLGTDDDFHDALIAFRHMESVHTSPVAAAMEHHQKERLRLTCLEPWDRLFLAPIGAPYLDARAFPFNDSFLNALRHIFELNARYFEQMDRDGSLILEPALSCPLADVWDAESTGERADYVFLPSTGSSTLVAREIPHEWFLSLLFELTGRIMLDQAEHYRNEIYLPRCFTLLQHELAAKSALFLSMRHWDVFYGALSQYAVEWTLSMLFARLAPASLFDAFERTLAQQVFADENEIREAWQQLCLRRYRETGQEAMGSFIPPEEAYLLSPKTWAHPFSGLYEGVALILTLASHPFRPSDHAQENRFLRLLNAEASERLSDVLDSAGYPTPFSDATFRQAMFAVADRLGL